MFRVLGSTTSVTSAAPVIRQCRAISTPDQQPAGAGPQCRQRHSQARDDNGRNSYASTTNLFGCWLARPGAVSDSRAKLCCSPGRKVGASHTKRTTQNATTPPTSETLRQTATYPQDNRDDHTPHTACVVNWESHLAVVRLAAQSNETHRQP